MNLLDKLKKNKVLPIIRSKSEKEVMEKAIALIEGGLDMMEINVESPEVFKAIKKISKSATVCAGGIITSIQAQAAIDCGAKFLSSPIFQSNLLKISKDKEIPLIAGTSTANEAYNAWKSRIPIVKIYPIAAMGGVEYLEDLLRPMPFLKVIPQGSVELHQIKSYLNVGALAVGVGRKLTGFSDSRKITERARELVESLQV